MTISSRTLSTRVRLASSCALLLCAAAASASNLRGIPATPGDVAWPSPARCIVSNPQAAYSPTPDVLTFATPQLGTSPKNYPVAVNLTVSQGLLATEYPNPLCSDGTCVNTLENSNGGSVVLNAATGTGKIDIEFDASDWAVGSMLRDKHITGRVRIVSTDFRGWNDEYVPFQRYDGNGVFRDVGGGISGNFLQHGCSGQGEPSFPLLKSRVSTWGHGDVYVDGKLYYKNLWMHTMYTNAYRSEADNAIHTKTYDAATNSFKANMGELFDFQKSCSNGYAAPMGGGGGGSGGGTPMQMTIVLARWCHDPNPLKLHPQTDLDMVVQFNGIQENPVTVTPSTAATAPISTDPTTPAAHTDADADAAATAPPATPTPVA